MTNKTSFPFNHTRIISESSKHSERSVQTPFHEQSSGPFHSIRYACKPQPRCISLDNCNHKRTDTSDHCQSNHPSMNRPEKSIVITKLFMNSRSDLCSTTDQQSTSIVVVGSTISISVTVGYKVVPTTMVIFVTNNLAWPCSLKGTAFKLGDKM